jgi:hypothetical protein
VIVSIRRLLKGSNLAPEEIDRLTMAYEQALRSLHLVDQDDPVAEIVAKKIIAIGATGVPAEMSKIVVEQLRTRCQTGWPTKVMPLDGHPLPSPRRLRACSGPRERRHRP